MEQTSFMKKLLTIFSPDVYEEAIEKLKLDVVSQPTIDVEKN